MRASLARIVLEIRAARAPASPIAHTFAIKTPGTDEAIEMAPPKEFDHPLTPEEARKEAQRIAMDYARKRTGNPDITWKQCKVMMDKWADEERDIERRARAAGTLGSVAVESKLRQMPTSYVGQKGIDRRVVKPGLGRVREAMQERAE